MKPIIFRTNGECPRCGETDDLDGGFVEIGRDEKGPIAWQRVRCCACGRSFTDIYRLEHTEVYEED